MAGEKREAIGALWLNESRDGKKYMSGSVNLPNGDRVKVVVFKNTFKQAGEKTPDYKIYPAEDRQQAPAPQRQERAHAEDNSDSIPF